MRDLRDRPNLEATPPERRPHRSPGVPPDGQEEHDVHHYEHHRIDGAAGGILVGYLGLDHQRQEVREKDHQASLCLLQTTERSEVEAAAAAAVAGRWVGDPNVSVQDCRDTDRPADGRKDSSAPWRLPVAAVMYRFTTKQHQPHRVYGATGRGFVGHLGLDHERQQVRENDNQAPLVFAIRSTVFQASGPARLETQGFALHGSKHYY